MGGYQNILEVALVRIRSQILVLTPSDSVLNQGSFHGISSIHFVSPRSLLLLQAAISTIMAAAKVDQTHLQYRARSSFYLLAGMSAVKAK